MQASAHVDLVAAVGELAPAAGAARLVCPGAPGRVGKLPPPPEMPAEVLAALRRPGPAWNLPRRQLQHQASKRSDGGAAAGGCEARRPEPAWQL